MRKILTAVACLFMVAACDKHDPILPGDRTAIFASADVNVLNISVPQLPDYATEIQNSECPYTQDSNNIIWNGDRKIFSGFPTSNSVSSSQHPICDGNYVYAGLTTGELVKVNGKNRHVVWLADIYSQTNMMGGASVVDITAPIILQDKWIYVGGLGDALCRVNATNGAKNWCDKISVGLPFVLADKVLFVVSADGNLYAVRTSDGAIYWRTAIKKQIAPIYEKGIISVGKQKINAETGEIIKK